MSSSPKATTPPSPPIPIPTPFTIGLITTLSSLRALAGFSCILAPTFTGTLFRLPIPATSTNAVLLRLFGVRDAVIGELLWTVRPAAASVAGERTKIAADEGAGSAATARAERKELKRILWANVATDGLDLVCVAVALGRGALGRPAAACVGGGAATFLVMGLMALRGL
jgi:hypothetical protein